MELSYIFLKKPFLIFREKYIENPGIFRARIVFRTLVYSVHCQASTMERFVKLATYCTFKPKLKKIKKIHLEKLSYISANGTF